MAEKFSARWLLVDRFAMGWIARVPSGEGGVRPRRLQEHFEEHRYIDEKKAVIQRTLVT